MRNGLTSVRRDSGQSIVETVLMLPLLLFILLNAVNFGYYFFVTLNLTAAPRTSVEYSTMGFETPAAISLPASGPPNGTLASSYITQQDMTGAVYNPTAASIQVCSLTNVIAGSGVNGTGATQRTNCVTCTGTTCTAPAAVTTGNLAPRPDPEPGSFLLNRVDVTYTFTPLIPGTPFNIAVLAVCGGGNSCTFHRFAEMREMN